MADQVEGAGDADQVLTRYRVGGDPQGLADVQDICKPVRIIPLANPPSHPYPLMPDEATLCTNHFWNSRKTMSTGMVIMEAKAKMSPHTLGS